MSANLEAVRQAHIDIFSRYAHALDTRNWPALANLFTADSAFKATPPPGAGDAALFSVSGRNNIAQSIGKAIDSMSATHHLMSNYVVDMGPDGNSAHASCYFRAYHAGKDERSHLFEESLGRFDLKTVRVGSEWKIRQMEESIMIMLGTPEAFGT